MLRNLYIIVAVLAFFILLVVPNALSAQQVEKTIAIMYFANNSPTKEYDCFQKGIASMLITDLSKLEELQIVEREELQKLLNEMKLSISGLVKQETAQELGNLLGAETLLLGSFTEVEGEIRIDARIVETETGKLLKAEEVTGKTRSLFDLEKVLVLKIARNLDVYLTNEQKEVISRVPTTSLEAAIHNFKGIDYYDRKMYEKAIREYTESLKIDSSYQDARQNLRKVFMKRGWSYLSDVNVYSTPWNPAETSSVKNKEFALQYADLPILGLLELKYYAVSYMQPVGLSATVGINWLIYSFCDYFNGTDTAGNPTGPLKVDETANAYILSASKQFGRRLQFGGNIKILNEHFIVLGQKYSLFALSFDAGSVYRLTDTLALSLLFQNLFPVFRGDNLSLKHTISSQRARIGLAYTPISERFTIFAQGGLVENAYQDGWDKTIKASLQYWILKYLFGVRAGFDYVPNNADSERFSVGSVFNLSNIEIDCDFLPSTWFGNSYTISATVRF